MNGIDAVAVALGQDWRAIESAAHSYASVGGRYLPLTKYWIEGEDFCGRIEMPISVGSQGGAIKSNPSYVNLLKILDFPDATQMAQIMISVGLAQNLAALRALSTEGIQKGHMNLHARNVAIRAGIPTELINDAVNFMKARNMITERAAAMYLKSHRMYSKSQTKLHKKDLSSFYVEIKVDFLPEPLILTVLLDSHTQNGRAQTYHLSIEKEPKNSAQEDKLVHHLFGGNKGYKWIRSFLGLLQSIRHHYVPKVQPEMLLTQNKLKLITILVNLLATHLSIIDRDNTFNFVQKIVGLIDNVGEDSQVEDMYHSIKSSIPRDARPSSIRIEDEQVESIVMSYGFNLLLELSYLFIVQCKSEVVPKWLRSMIVKEFR